MSAWRFGREDLLPALLIIALPLAIAMPQLLGALKADPMLTFGALARDFAPGWLDGWAHVDPNSAYTTHALGRRAAMDWLSGAAPWWNPYSGVGLPLAAEYQPAAFFPLIFLLLLPQGTVWLQLSLEVLGGLGTYALLRQLGIGRLAATTGAILYALNGTLAWFAHAPALPVPFLPWLLLGIERAFMKASARLPDGWRLLAAAMALSLLAGFPETAFLNGLLALAWALLRGIQSPRGLRGDYARRIALGGTVGIALAAPQIVAFFGFLPHAFLGGHGGDFAHHALPLASFIPSLVAPYAYGPIFGFVDRWPLLTHVWGSVGGYVSVVLVMMAAYGFWTRRDALSILLLAWIVLALAKTFGLEPATTMWNLVPGISITAFFRYAQPSWELAFVVLAARGLDSLAHDDLADRNAFSFAAAAAAAAVLLGAALFYGERLWPILSSFEPMRNWALAAASWAILTAVACLVLLKQASGATRARALAGVLVVDAALMFAVPTLSNPRAGVVNIPAVHFLRDNLGLQRFFTLGPIQPNYGAFFRIASINHNYLPVSQRWADWVRRHLDTGWDDPPVFDGKRATAAAQLHAHLAAYEWLGVKYVVAPGDENPLAGMKGSVPRRVYADGSMSIYELADPRPYFESVSGLCTLEPRDRTRLLAKCAGPETLVRRELFFPGWRARVGAGGVPIAEHQGLFQAIALPMGKSEVRFDYAPPHIGWAWLAFFAALIAWMFPTLRRRFPMRRGLR